MKDFLQAIVYGGLFLVLFLPLLVANDLFFPFITGKNFAFRIIVEVVFAAWIVLALLDSRYRPRFSWLLVTLFSFLAIVTVAALLGEHPPTSFWSNYERMDGVVTILHLALYALVLGSANFSVRTCNTFLATSVGVATFVAIKGLFALASGGAPRVDSTLGNAAYMAVYMLFHIFFVALLFIRSRGREMQIVYALIAALFVYTLLLTGTRGTFLGLVGGSVVSVLYIALFGSRLREYRKVAIGGLVALVLLGATLYAVRDSAFIQNNISLARIANIDLKEDLGTRSTIWGMALEGVKERPLLGWGHGNFNFVFNREYQPELYNQEQWFDRVHDIFLDWLIAAGIFGFIAYFSVFGAFLYYLVWQPLWQREAADLHFSVLERAVLLGLLAGYLIHNVVVFDNIISYIFYGTLIALIHARVATPVKRFNDYRVPERIVTQVVLPLVVVAASASVYFINIPSYQAAGDIIDAMRATTPAEKLAFFDTAIKRDGFGNQEIVEQLAQQAMSIARDPAASEEDRTAFILRAESELLRLAEEKPNDARIHIFLANYYRAVNDVVKAKEQAAITRSLTPQKPSVIIEQGAIELQLGNGEGARDFFKEAYELAPGFDQARILYAATLIQLGEPREARALLSEEAQLRAFAMNDYAVSVVQNAKDLAFLAELFERRVAITPEDPQNWASLAFIYFELGNKDKAVDTLNRAGEAVPMFAPQAACIAGNIRSGRAPETPCTPGTTKTP